MPVHEHSAHETDIYLSFSNNKRVERKKTGKSSDLQSRSTHSSEIKVLAFKCYPLIISTCKNEIKIIPFIPTILLDFSR